MTADHLARLEELDTCAVSDALDHLRLPGATLGIAPLWGRPKLVARARTISLRDALGDVGGDHPHIATATISTAGAGEVIVIANRGRVDVACWGDILTAAAQYRGIAGAVIDGACRDLDAVADAHFPVFGRAAVTRTARGRLAEEAHDVPVDVAGVHVAPLDYVIADGSGVVFVPAHRIDEVITLATRLARRQSRMREAVAAGASVVGVMKDKEFEEALGDNR